ncbi:4Fe-4S dicluster domain-containing protein [Clostridium sp.]|uniref:4Fe-4S dicluster domain-containing protein n=1 Tax=Clostridium sp. TaxID=1506 RepID=UPI001DBB1658|nr:4Fe-4S dicluster domain-containing protein [Clostridium sp.]MBS5986952.1 4Fe-4S dicluster domain-containing protein [Clostridium sp.]
MSLFNLIKQTKISKEESLYPTKQCVFYLEGKGVNTTALVKKGDEVVVGSVIGKEKEDLSIPVLSSVNGSVIEIRDTYNTEGKKAKAVVVEVTENTKLEEKEVNINSLSKEEILNKIQEFGLLDETGVPLSLKYRAFSGNKLLVKGFSYESNIAYYDFLNVKEKEINKALEVLNKLFVSLDIKKADSKSVSKKTIELKREELISKFFGKDAKNEDVIVEDILTLVYLGECFLSGQPHLDEYVVVSGSAVKENVLLKVKLGTTLDEVLETLGGNKEELGKVVVGGALRGLPQFSEDSAISYNAKAILFLNAKDATKASESPCIRCAKCLRACPEGLNPIKLMELWERGEKEEFLKFGGNKCIECGLCSYVCPSKIEVANKIVTAKAFIK